MDGSVLGSRPGRTTTKPPLPCCSISDNFNTRPDGEQTPTVNTRVFWTQEINEVGRKAHSPNLWLGRNLVRFSAFTRKSSAALVELPLFLRLSLPGFGRASHFIWGWRWVWGGVRLDFVGSFIYLFFYPFQESGCEFNVANIGFVCLLIRCQRSQLSLSACLAVLFYSDIT